MPVFLQEKLIQWILNPLSKITERIPMAAKDAAFALSAVFITLMVFASGGGFYTGRYLYVFLLGCCFLGLMILAGMTPELRPVRFSRPLTVCWMGVTLFMLLTGFLVETDALSGAILWLVVFPVFYMVWQGGFDRLVSLTIRGVILSFLLFIAVSLFLYPINGINYSSFYLNRNRAGMYLTAVFVCLLTYVFSRRTPSPLMFTAELLSGFVGATIYYTSSRTSIMACIICFFTTGLFHLFLQKKERRRILLVQLLPIAAATLILIPTAIHIYRACNHVTISIQTALHSPEKDTNAPGVEPLPELPPETDASEVLDHMRDYAAARFDTKDTTLNDFTAGRAEIWSIYLREVGLLGNPSGRELYDSSGELIKLSSHLTVLQFAYTSGAPAGLFFLLLNILAGLASIRCAVKRHDFKYRLFPFAAAITFGAVSVMEAIGGALTDTLSLLYFISLTPLIATPLPAETPGKNKR